MAIEITPSNARQRRPGAALPQRPGRAHAHRHFRPMLVANQSGVSRQQHRYLEALAELPPAHRGPVLRAGHATADWLAPPRPRRPAPLVPRLLAGEFQRRLVLTLIGVSIFVIVVTALGASLLI